MPDEEKHERALERQRERRRRKKENGRQEGRAEGGRKVIRTENGYGVWSINLGGASCDKIKVAKKEAGDTGATVVIFQETRLGKAGGARRQRVEEAVQREMNKWQYEVAAQEDMGEIKRGKIETREGEGKVGVAILAKRGMGYKQKHLKPRTGVEGVAIEVGKVLIRCVYATANGHIAEELKGAKWKAGRSEGE